VAWGLAGGAALDEGYLLLVLQRQAMRLCKKDCGPGMIAISIADIPNYF